MSSWLSIKGLASNKGNVKTNYEPKINIQVSWILPFYYYYCNKIYYFIKIIIKQLKLTDKCIKKWWEVWHIITKGTACKSCDGKILFLPIEWNASSLNQIFIPNQKPNQHKLWALKYKLRITIFIPNHIYFWHTL